MEDFQISFPENQLQTTRDNNSESRPRPLPFRRLIPIYPRDRYYSYLKVLGIHKYLRSEY
jgi:hypothetical protein